jgi:hypothetical protein
MKTDFWSQVDQADGFPEMMDGKVFVVYPGWKSFHLESKV